MVGLDPAGRLPATVPGAELDLRTSSGPPDCGGPGMVLTPSDFRSPLRGIKTSPLGSDDGIAKMIALPTMSFFNDPSEIDKYIGGVFRDAGEHQISGPKFRAANIVMRVVYTDPDHEITVALREDFQVHCGPSDLKPDVTLTMPADVADRFWRGDYNLTIGLAKGQVKAKGPIGKILRLIPLTKPLFPMYRAKIADKDGVGR